MTPLFACAALGLALSLSASPPGPPSLDRLDAPALAARLRADAHATAIYRQGLLDTLAFLDGRPDLVPAEKLGRRRVLGSAERATLVQAWQRFLDYLLALDSLAQYHRGFHRLRGTPRAASLLIFEAAWIAEYRASLDLFTRLERDRGLDVILNEAAASLAFAAGTYTTVKSRFLDPARYRELAALEVLRHALRPPEAAGLSAGIAADRLRLVTLGRPVPALTLGHAWRLVGRAGFTAWFPVQAGVSEWMGDTKLLRRGVALVTPAQIALLGSRLEPGDLLLERREWYLSNVGLPGYWPHAAIYIGTSEERSRYFEDPEVHAWIEEQRGAGSIEELIRARHPLAWAQSGAPFEGHAPRVLEAMSEGVVFTSLEHSAAADSLAVLRPRLRKVDKAAAILAAFQYAGRPYDFNFDFLTDTSLVCTELVFKAYQPSQPITGLRLPLVEILGRPSLPANEIVRRFDLELGTPAQQLDLILFLDGDERGRRAVERGVDDFRHSWTRPKWHLLRRPPVEAAAGLTADP